MVVIAAASAACSSSKADAGATTAGAGGGGSSGVDDGSGGDSQLPTAGSGSPAGSATGGASSASGGSSSGGQGGDPGTGAEAGSSDPGGIGSCFGALWGGYVQRTDGVLLAEGSSEQTVLDSATGLPLVGAVSVQDGEYHGCAAISDGSAQCWQLNSTNGNRSGQLGNGTTTTSDTLWRSTPVLTAANTPLTNVNSMAYGSSNSACAVTNDASLYCWGDLTWLVNNGKTLLTGYAQQITTDGSTPFANVQQVALGYRQACALVQGSAANEVWCWGYNGEGELGQGDSMTRQYPTKVLGLTNPTWLAISPDGAADATVCAQDGDGIRCWGYNNVGQAGVNSATTPTPGPTLVVNQAGTALSGVVDVEPGAETFSALLSDGTLWNWGWNLKSYAANYGLTNIVAIGYAGGYLANGPRYVTSDGIYHSAMSNVSVNCGAL